MSDDSLLYPNFHRVWYLRTLPGRTGSFLGHAIAGVLIGLVGLGMLLFSLYRARNLQRGKSFAESHIPEQNPVFLKWFGLMFMVFVPIGMIYDIADKEDGYDPVSFTHCVIYACDFLQGPCAYFESKKRVPADTHRAAMVLSFVLQGLIWMNHHGSLPPDMSLHILLGYANFAGAAAMIYSMRFTDSVFAYLAGWCAMCLKGMMLVTIGLYECCINITEHEVPLMFVLYCVFLFLSILLAVACLVNPEDNDDDHDPILAHLRNKEFSPLADNCDDSEETEETDEDDNRFIA